MSRKQLHEVLPRREGPGMSYAELIGSDKIEPEQRAAEMRDVANEVSGRRGVVASLDLTAFEFVIIAQHLVMFADAQPGDVAARDADGEIEVLPDALVEELGRTARGLLVKLVEAVR